MYRRVRILAIGKDVYCDSSLIAAVLERRFSPSEGFGTLFPRRKGGGSVDTGMIKTFAVSYADKTLGELGEHGALSQHACTVNNNTRDDKRPRAHAP